MRHRGASDGQVLCGAAKRRPLSSTPGAPTASEKLFLTDSEDSYFTRRFSYLAGDASINS